MESPRKNWERGGLEGFHAGKWNELHPYNTLLCSPIWELQLLQEGKSHQEPLQLSLYRAEGN